MKPRLFSLLDGYFQKTIITLIAAFMSHHAYAATQCSVSTEGKRIPLIELYTSEGCSSCPPADSWLRKSVVPLTQRGQVSALAWHVDYWDQLGWRDRFASPLYSDRQRIQGRFGKLRAIYTPQVTLNGLDRPSWRYTNGQGLAEQSGDKSNVQINLAVNADSKTVQTALQGLNDERWYLALYQDGLSSQVKAGENSGEKLSHDRVVRLLKGPYTNSQSEKIQLDTPADFDWNKGGVVAFVQRNGDVVQSLTLPFANCTN